MDSLQPAHTTLVDALGPVAALEQSELASYLARAQARAVRVADGEGVPLYTLEGDGVAVISVEGPLGRYALAFRDFVWLDGYDRIANAVRSAEAEPDVRAIAFRVDSPGGAVNGLFEMLRALTAGEHKPRVTLIDELGASAGKAVALLGDEVYVTPEALDGSIGVYTMHTDISRMLDRAGVTMTPVQDPAGKTTGSPYRPLDEEGRAQLQERVSSLATTFYQFVADRRGMTVDAVRALNARLFMGQKAVDAGLADGVASWAQVISRAEELARNKEQKRMKEAMALLGLPANASAEDVDKAALAAKPLLGLGRAALELTGEQNSERAQGVLAAWKRDSADAERLRADAKAQAETNDAKERHALLVALAQVEPPAHVWADPKDTGKGPVAELAELSTPALRTMVERRTRAPRPVALGGGLTGSADASAEPTEDEVNAYMKANNVANYAVAYRRVVAEKARAA